MTQTYTVLYDMSRAVAASDRATSIWERVPSLRMERTELSNAEVQDRLRAPEVKAVSPVMPTTLIRPVDADRSDSVNEDAPDGVAWGISAVGAMSSRRTGSGVVPAVLDTGIDGAHPAFSGVTLVQEDFSGDGLGDRQGHGTHCAGTIFGRTVDQTRIGVAPGVGRALIAKVLGDDGQGDSDMLFRGMHWASTQGAQVISMSLGFDFPGMVNTLVLQEGWPVDLATSNALRAYRANLRMFDAIMRLFEAQIEFTRGSVVVAASGNESKRALSPDYVIGVSLPAAAEGVLSTGAVGRSAQGLQVAPFSNAFPQVVGPGVSVLSAKADGGLVALSGTSMATPHTAGVACLWWEEIEKSPIPLTSTTVASRLLSTATWDNLAKDVNVADRGVGLVQAPA